MLVRGVYGGYSRGHVTGTIIIDSQAHRSVSSFESSLLLQNAGAATSIPILEVAADDVQVSHSSATSSIRPDQLWYLMSRGISRSHAERLIVCGFLGDALSGSPCDARRNTLEYIV
jgi:Fe-S cluster assembly protein SufD